MAPEALRSAADQRPAWAGISIYAQRLLQRELVAFVLFPGMFIDVPEVATADWTQPGDVGGRG